MVFIYLDLETVYHFGYVIFFSTGNVPELNMEYEKSKSTVIEI